MSTRSVVILLIVALSLAVMVLLFEREVGREVEPGPDEYKVFKAYAKDQVKLVNLVRGDLTVQLVRQGEGWQMNSPVRAVAASKRVEKLLEQLGDLMEVARPIKGQAGEKIDLEQYGLSNPWGKIIVSYGGVTGAQLSLGQRTRKHNQLYARLGEENRVMVIDAKVIKLLEEVAADENFYRSRRIFQDRHINKALSIELVSSQMPSEKSIVLVKDQNSGRWLLSLPVKDRADGQAVRKLLDKCADLRVVEFILNIDQTKPADQAKLVQMLEVYGLTGRGEAGAVLVEAEGMQVVLVHLGRADKQGKFRYALVENRAMLAGNRELVKIPAEFVEVLPRSAEALRDRRFLSFESQAVNEVRTSGPEGEIVLGQGRSSEGQVTGQWLIQKPLETAADKDIVESFLKELQELRARSFAGTVRAEMGFNNPYLRIKVNSDEKGKGEILEIGALTANSQARYARLKRDRVVRRVDAAKVDGLVHDSLYFYERKLADVDRRKVKSFRITMAGDQKDEVEAVYKEDQWWLSKPVAVRGQNDIIRDVLGIFDPLRAQRIVADGVAENDTAALVQYGLDEPGYKLTVVQKKDAGTEPSEQEGEETTAKATQEHVLLIGSAVADGQDEEYYSLLRGREVVFTIRKTAVDKLGGDLRSKKVLPLTNRQIARLSKVEIIRPGELLSLEKPRENWQVVAPKKFWPNQEAVKRLLESIVVLSAAEFGTEPDEKQYGLDKPTMTVSVGLAEEQGDKQKVYRFVVGKLLKDKGYAIKTEDEDIVRLVAAEKLEALGQSYLAYRKKEMLSLKRDKIRGIEIVHGKGKAQRAERDQMGGWQLKVPAGGALELAKLDAILKLMSGLRAKDLVADTLEQDREFGLDKPALTVTIEAVGEENEKVIYTLLIGAAVEDESGSRYARLEGDSTVFVLAGEDVDVLEEGLVFEVGN